MANEQTITLTEDEAIRLRDALRKEASSRELHELAVLRARVDALEASSVRRAIFESLADAHDFDATDVFDFDYPSRTLTKKGK